MSPFSHHTSATGSLNPLFLKGYNPASAATPIRRQVPEIGVTQIKDQKNIY
ncbi:hypothetical protein BN2497_11933 [Janthinobacterium sp. CG23_2]|nr:hypothetical protein BN2497_11933 [Janthinobacterium sp. CG23_2]CUU32364.1 hypothetical protein BN3177_11933 [Janthinobacterium sp. CG23_2]